MGALAAAFFTAIVPQLTQHRNAFGLDTDTKRALRLVGQPLCIAWALWATRQSLTS